MKAIQLLENLEFHDKTAYAQPLFVDPSSRVLRFHLKPGQSVREHQAPHSPVYLAVLKGHGMFAGGDSPEEYFGPNTLLVFNAGENHSMRALDEGLVCLVILHGAPSF